MRYLAASLLTVCLAPMAIAAQTEYKTDILTGRVTDLSGRPVADAQVGATSLATGLTRSRATDSTGRYRIVFSEHAPQYQLVAKRMGFTPVQRTIRRVSSEDEQINTDMRFGGAPLALSMVEVTGNPNRAVRGQAKKSSERDPTVPNPVADILALKDSLHLSAVQIVGLTDLADSLQAKNTALFTGVHTYILKQRGNGDPAQIANTVSQMLQEASTNTDRAVAGAQALLRPEQWILIPQGIRDRPLTDGVTPDSE